MWFKNMLIYRLTQDLPFDPQVLGAALATKLAHSCSSQEIATYGFVPPLGKGEKAPLVHASQDFMLIAARKEERILPSSVVRDALKDKIEEIEVKQMRKVYKKERDQLKDEIIRAFLPRAFIRRSDTFAAIAPKQGLILINASSPFRAEDLLSALRQVIGSLPVRPLAVKVAPSAVMTEWVKIKKSAENFFILDECELRDNYEDGGIIRCKRQDLTSDEIQLHLSSGKVVTQLSLAWKGQLSFTLDDKLVVKRLKFDSLLQDEVEQNGGDDDLGRQDASFTLMMLTFGEFLPQLFEALGGEQILMGI